MGSISPHPKKILRLLSLAPNLFMLVQEPLGGLAAPNNTIARLEPLLV